MTARPGELGTERMRSRERSCSGVLLLGIKWIPLESSLRDTVKSRTNGL